MTRADVSERFVARIADGRTDLVFDHLAGGGDARTTDDHGNTLVKGCAYYGDVSAIKHLLANGEAVASLGDNFDLNGASFHGHWRLCQYLIELGADVNLSLPETGETPLHSALCKANRPTYDHVVRVLLANGGDPNCETKASAETGAFLRDSRTKAETPLHRAAAFGTEASVRMLLGAGAVVDARDMNGDSPLAWASWHLRPAAILKLLCYGDHRISAAAVCRHAVDHGSGWGGLEANLLGNPHV